MMQVKDIYQRFLECSGVNTDTRNIDKGSMFFALKGPNFDANKYAASAIAKGSKYVVVDDPSIVMSDEYILVEDCLSTLQELAKFHRSKLSIPVIGITGSNGKTTSKELIDAVLKTQYRVCSTIGNLNNHIGVPLTLLSIKQTDEIAIVEMGANHVGEIEFLCDLCNPNYGLITNIGKAHLEGFGSIENIIKTKRALYNSVYNNDGLTFVNKSDSLLLDLSDCDKSVYFQDENSFFAKLDFINSGELAFSYYKNDFKSSIIKTHLVGDFNLTNVMAAISIGYYFNISVENIHLALTEYKPQNNRSQYLKAIRTL